MGGFSFAQFFRDYDITPNGEFLMVFPADECDVGDSARPQSNIVLNCYEDIV
jgi:hypothetical protein